MALMTFDEYFKKYNGVGIDFDGQYSYQCFTANHYVLMEDWTYKAIQDIEVGDRVIGYDNEVNTVLQTHKRKAEVIKVKTDLGDIIVTKDHPFYFLDGSFDSILAGDEKKYALFDKRNYAPSGLTDEELMMLGFWLGDGSLARHHDGRKPEIRITYGETKVPFIESLNMVSNVQRHSCSEHAFNASIRKREHPLLTEIIYRCYNEKKEKILPLIFTPYEYEKIIKGYCRADGSEKNNSMVVTSTSKSLLLSIQAAAILCGWNTKSIRPMKERKYPVYINGHAVKNLKPSWRMTLTKSSKTVYRQIQEIEYLGEETVYNIGTDGSHTYICDNYKVHNCFDLANDYAVKVIGAKPFVGMYAYEIYTNFANQPSKDMYTRIANTPEFVPQKGDIIVWSKALNGTAGHVAVCDGVGDTTYFYSYEENWDGMNHPTERVKHNYNYILGVLRPKDQSRIKTNSKNTTTTTKNTATTNTGTVKYSNSPLATKKNLFTQNYNDRGGKKIDRITVHHMAGNLTIDGCKNALNSREGSVNYAIQSDGQIGLLLEEKNRAWTSSSPENDYRAVTIEVANAPGAGEPDWKVTDAALQSTIKLCADICKRNGIKKLTFTGQLAGSNLTMHKWFYATGCPGKYLGGKFPYIVQEVNKILNGSNSSATTAPTTPATPTPTVSYKTMYVNAKDGLNYRDKPSGNIRGAYKNGTLVRYVVGSETKSGGYTWVKMDNGFYIAKDYLSEKKPSTTTKKSNTEIAKEVIAGKWGNGEERVKKLTAAGYNASEVQKEVNKLLKG